MLASLIHSLWYSSWNSLLHMELYASKGLLLVTLGKPYGPVAREITILWCCGQTHTGGRWAQEPGHYIGPCGWRTGLETPIRSVMWAVRSPQAACMMGPHGCLGSLTGSKLKPVSGSCESLTVGHRLYGAPTVPKFCKKMCWPARYI